MIAELREGWAEFRKHTWLWATVIQYCLVMMAWNGGFMVLGPVVARAHLGGAAAWGAISAADALGLVLGGLISLRYTPRKPMLFVVCTGGAFTIAPLILGLVAPLPVICVVAFALGTLVRGDDGAVDGADGDQDPFGQAGPGVVLRRVRLAGGDAARGAGRLPPRRGWASP